MYTIPSANSVIMSTVLRGKIETIGKEILAKYCQSSSTSKPIMIPPVPDSKFLEKFPKTTRVRRQDGYIAEVEVYRCFEELERDVLVIHQIKYTHQQYSAFVPDHNCTSKKCQKPEVHPCHHDDEKNAEGENDFVVIGPDFVADFEVKGHEIPANKNCASDMFKGYCVDAARQRNRMVKLVEHLNGSVDVYQFTIFPNISKKEVDAGYLSDATLLFSEEFKSFNSWFEANICSLGTGPRNINSAMISVKGSLLGLWCIKTDNNGDTSDCSLSKCIMDINTKLEKALVTQQAIDQDDKSKNTSQKKYRENPEMVEAPDLFKDYLDINCLTQDQLDVFECKDRFLWVEGPAGSGKTIAMLGKIIDIVLNNDTEHVLIMSFGWKTSPAVQLYHEVLNKISEDISCSIVEYAFLIEGLSDLKDKAKVTAAERSLLQQINNSSSRIIILALNFTLISSINISDFITSRFDCVFVDDYHSFHDHLAIEVSNFSYKFNMLSDGLLPVIKECSTNNTSLWVFSDIGQSTLIYRILNISTVEVRKELNEFKNMFLSQKVLSVNLRNSHEISAVLSVIRKHYNAMELSGKGTLGLNQPKNGHFLRGTKPTIYLLRDDDPAACEGILEKELCKLRGPDSCLEDKDIAVLYDGDKKYRKNVQKTAESLLRMRNNDIAVQYTNDCRSYEWPAVVYLHRLTTVKIPYTQSDNSVKEITFSYTIPFLYQALSRARVYSTVIIYNYRPNACEYTDNMLSELRERTDICRIVDL